MTPSFREITPASDRVRGFLRRTAERYVPGLVTVTRSIRNRRRFAHAFGAGQRDFFCRQFSAGDAPVVLAGPFAGMTYLNETVWGPITPRWIGSYEAELHEKICALSRGRHRRLVDVGCAEGYYAVGFARARSELEVLAFDTDPFARAQCRRLAQTNGVAERIRIGSWCRHDDLQALSGSDTLVLCDIEGAEWELLDPRHCPALDGTDLLVELHSRNGTSLAALEAEMCVRFGKTHRFEIIVQQSRVIGSWRPFVSPRISDGALAAAMDERRGEMQRWLHLPARSRDGEN